MSRTEIALMLAGAILLSALALWAAIYIIDTYVFADDPPQVVIHRR